MEDKILLERIEVLEKQLAEKSNKNIFRRIEEYCSELNPDFWAPVIFVSMVILGTIILAVR